MEKKKPELLVLLKDELIKQNNNYKEFDSMLFHKLVMSVTLYGQILPLVVVKHNEKYKIISGNKLFVALQQAGYTEFNCVVIEDKYNVADIILNELQFKTNYIELGDRLLETDIDSVKKILPLTEDEVMKIKMVSSYDWSQLIKKKDENQSSLFDLDEEELNEEQKDETLLINIIDTKGTENILQTKEIPEIIEQQKPDVLLPSEQRKLDAQKVVIIESVAEEKLTEEKSKPVNSEKIIIQIPVLIEINNFTTQTKYIPSNLEYKFKELFGDRKVTQDEYDNFMVDNLEIQNPNQKSLF